MSETKTHTREVRGPSLDVFFATQRDRVLETLTDHLARVRERIREYEAGEYEPEWVVEVRGAV